MGIENAGSGSGRTGLISVMGYVIFNVLTRSLILLKRPESPELVSSILAENPKLLPGGVKGLLTLFHMIIAGFSMYAIALYVATFLCYIHAVKSTLKMMRMR